MTARKSVWAGVRGVNGRMAEIFTRASLKQQTSSYRYRNEWKPMAALHQQWCKVYMISHGPVCMCGLCAETVVHCLVCLLGHRSRGGLGRWCSYRATVQTPQPAPPLLRLRVLLFLSIDLPHFHSRNHSAGLSTQLTFPRTLPIPISMILKSWPIFPQCSAGSLRSPSLQLQREGSKGNIQNTVKETETISIV